MTCPRCTAPMRALRLSSHRHEPVTVDHCPDCRLVWFDRLESVQLDALGWVRLLRKMEEGAGRPLAQAQVGRPACPSCRQPLKPVQNRTRFGLFAVLECPVQHGHLHSHSGLLAERGLVRPLGAPERLALAQQKQPLHCFNCNGPAEPMDKDCRWCGSALVVVDLPRLAHSLQVRDEAQGPLPAGRGRHVPWPCRGCGAPLDPGREASCSRCGQLVVAQDLPDLRPLLEAAEARLAPAAAARAERQRQAERRYRNESDGRGERAAPAGLLARTLMLHGWLPLLLLAVLALALAAASVGGVVGRGVPPLEALRLQPVGADAAAAWHWVAEHRRLAPTDTQAQRQLGRAALDLHLRHAAGVAIPANLTVGQLLDDRYGRVFPPSDDEFADRQGAALARSLRLEPASESDPLPPAPDLDASRFSPAGPGLWVERERRSQGLWAPELLNAGQSALKLGPLQLRMVQGRGLWLGWRCQPAAPADGGVAAGQRVVLLCRSQGAPAGMESLWAWAVEHLRQGQPVPLEWADESLRAPGRIEALIDSLVAQAARPAKAPVVKRPSLRERWQLLAPRQQQLLGLAALLAGFVAYSAMARRFGVRRSFIAWMLMAAPLSVVFGGGQGPASVLFVGMTLSVAALVAWAYTWGFRLYRDWFFQRFERRA